MQMCVCQKEHERGNSLCVLRSLHVFPGQRCELESPRLQQSKHATSAKHLINWDWSVCKCSDTNADLQTAIFLILVVRNNKRTSDTDGKTSDCLSRICLYYRYLESRFCQELFSESSELVIVVFLASFLILRAPLVKTH